ncbi:hypothetical protein FQA39_LY18506 [Lamprigera yunnana]|nr:hypothetical protein FQA39_LY18506 [Lamprigera yunnana]
MVLDECFGMASKVWKTFEKVRKIDGRKSKFWIQTLDSSQMEVVEKLMFKNFINEEPLCTYNRLFEDEASVLDVTEYYKYLMSLGLSFVCMTNDDNGLPKIAGFSITTIESKNGRKFEATGEVSTRILELFDYLHRFKNLYTLFGVEEVLEDKGIYVLPEYRGFGISSVFLNCWKLLAEEKNLKVVCGIFTSKFSQNSAVSSDYTELTCKSYKEIRNLKPHLVPNGIEEHTKATGEVSTRILELFDYLHRFKNLYTLFGVEEVLEDKGIYVLPEYRGLGISSEFLNCWKLLAEEKNLKVVCGIFTSKFSQNSAVSSDYTELTCKSYKEIRNLKPHLVPNGIEEHTEVLKIFYCEI